MEIKKNLILFIVKNKGRIIRCIFRCVYNLIPATCILEKYAQLKVDFYILFSVEWSQKILFLIKIIVTIIFRVYIRYGCVDDSVWGQLKERFLINFDIRLQCKHHICNFCYIIHRNQDNLREHNISTISRKC